MLKMVYNFLYSHSKQIMEHGMRLPTADSCGTESLFILELDKCLLITHLTLQHLESCHNLERIELFVCQLITRAVIHKLKTIQ